MESQGGNYQSCILFILLLSSSSSSFFFLTSVRSMWIIHHRQGGLGLIHVIPKCLTIEREDIIINLLAQSYPRLQIWTLKGGELAWLAPQTNL